MLDNSKGLGFGVCNRFFNTVLLIVWVIGDLMRGSDRPGEGCGRGVPRSLQAHTHVRPIVHNAVQSLNHKTTIGHVL